MSKTADQYFDYTTQKKKMQLYTLVLSRFFYTFHAFMLFILLKLSSRN